MAKKGRIARCYATAIAVLTSNFGMVGDTDAADAIVPGGGHLAGTPRPVAEKQNTVSKIERHLNKTRSISTIIVGLCGMAQK